MKTLYALLLTCSCLALNGQEIDPTFQNPIPLRAADIKDIKALPDGKALIGGEIDFFDSTPVKNLFRLNADGTRDANFSFNGENFIVSSIKLQSNGNAVVSDRFSMKIVGTDGTVLSSIARPQNTISIQAIEVQPDDKILMAIRITSTAVLKRLNPDGSPDGTFNEVSFNGQIGALAIQNGKILAGGSFSQVNGSTHHDIVRLELDGTTDPTFNTGSGTTDFVLGMTIQPDGKILLGNGFINSFNGESFDGFCRLNADGSVDQTFAKVQLSSGLLSDLKLNGDKIVFTTYFSDGFSEGRFLFQLNNDGTRDNSFPEIKLGDEVVAGAIEVLPSGIVTNGAPNRYQFGKYSLAGLAMPTFAPKISRYGSIGHLAFAGNDLIVGGDFVKINDHETYHVARLSKSGVVDNSFTVAINNGSVFQLHQLSNNTTLVSSEFDFFKVDANGNETPDFQYEPFKDMYQVIIFRRTPDGRIYIAGPNNVARLNADGTEDVTFVADPGTGGPVSTGFGMDMQTDGKVLYGSIFDSWNGTPVNKLTRINTNGSIDNSFNIGTGPNGQIWWLATLPNNETLVSGFFSQFNGVAINQRIVKLRADGSVDETFLANYPSDVMSLIDNAKLFRDKIFISDNHSLLKLLESNGSPASFSLPGEFSFTRLDDIFIEDDYAFFISGESTVSGQRRFLTRFEYPTPPVITAVSISPKPEDVPFEISLSNVTAIGGAGTFPVGYTLTLLPGSNYSVSNNTITPASNYFGTISLTAKINDGQSDSAPFSFDVLIQPVNDKPVITAVTTGLKTNASEALAFTIQHLTVSDPDNSFPSDFTYTIKPGSGYTVTNNQLVPGANTFGQLSASVTVSDGSTESEPFNFMVDVTPRPLAITAVNLADFTEDIPRDVALSNIVVDDVTNTYPTGFTLSITPGNNYTASGSRIIPATNYNGPITVTFTIGNGERTATASKTLNVNAVNDVPVITAVNPEVRATPTEALDFGLDDISVTDPDNNYPSDFSFRFVANEDYSIVNGHLIPKLQAKGKINATIVVNDGLADSEPFTFEVHVNIVTALSREHKNSISIFPNPVDNALTITLPDAARGSSFIVQSISGTMMVSETSVNSVTIDTSLWPAGIYFVGVTEHKGNVSWHRIAKR